MRILFLILLSFTWIVCTSASSGTDGNQIPQTIATLPIAGSFSYAWRTDNELLLWSMLDDSRLSEATVDDHRNPNFSLFDVGTKANTSIEAQVRLPEQTPNNVLICKGYAAWLAWDAHSEEYHLRLIDLASSYSHTYSLHGGPFHGPAWCTIGGMDVVAVIGEEPEGPVVLIIDPHPGRPLQVVRLIRGSEAANNLARCSSVLGVIERSKLICVEHNVQEGSARIITFDAAKPDAPVETQSVTFPDAYDETDAVLCGEKIVWLLTKSDADAMWFGRPPRPTHELWTSTLGVGRTKRLIRVAHGGNGNVYPPFLDYPHSLRKKPGESAVTYIQGNKLILVPIK